jgi:hypothetical protein
MFLTSDGHHCLNKDCRSWFFVFPARATKSAAAEFGICSREDKCQFITEVLSDALTEVRVHSALFGYWLRMQKAQRLGMSRSRQYAPAPPGGPMGARGPTRAEFLRASVGGILRSTGAAAADQPWRNPSLAARVRRPFRILGWKRCASAHDRLAKLAISGGLFRRMPRALPVGGRATIP